MKLTAKQRAALKPYEKNMRTAVKSDWTRGVSTTAVRLMESVRNEVTGKVEHVGPCPNCILNLVRTVGKWYFADIEALEKAAARKAAKKAANGTKV